MRCEMLLHTDNKQLFFQQLFDIFHYLHALSPASTVTSLSFDGNIF